MEYTGLIGGIYKVSLWISRFAAINILWLLFNLPIIYFVFTLLSVDSPNDLMTIGMTTVIIIPFIFFPATTAMFGIIRKWILGHEINMLSSFWKYYKENYVKSLLGGILIVLIWILLIEDYYFYLTTNSSEFFSYFFSILTLLLFVSTLHFFSLTVHMNITLLQIFKNAIYFTFRSPLLTLQLVISTGIVIVLSFSMMTFLIPFFLGSLLAYFSFSSFLRSLVIIKEKI